MIWDLIVIGAGSAAAYYLSTVDRSLFPNILVIGQPDPWGGERGYNASAPKDPVNFINHTWQMIAHLGNVFPDFDMSVVDRHKFAEANKNVIDSCATRVVVGKVTNIEEVTDPDFTFVAAGHKGPCHVFRVTTDADGAHEGKKIVVATGAGPHRVPDEVKHLNQPSLIMNMDEFARRAGTFLKPEEMTVFVQGPNAAIDSVETAKFQKFNVIWLIKPPRQGQGPAILATPHQIYARAALKSDVVVYPEHDRGTAGFRVELTGGNPPLKVTVPGKSAPYLGHMLVFGMGQEPKDAMDGVVPNAFRNRLQPIYDINQRFGAAHETVVGLKLENSDWCTGFEIVGALATQVARGAKVPHTYKKELADRIDEVRAKVLPFLTGTIGSNHLTAGILLEPLSKIEGMSPGDARIQLKAAREHIARTYPTWTNHVDALTSLMLNYIQVARYFAGKDKVSDQDLSAASRILTPSIIQGPQLGVIRSQTAAQNGAIPGYIGGQAAMFDLGKDGKPVFQGVVAGQGGRVNFSQDDYQVLRIYIALNYPSVLEDDADRFIKRVMARRPDVNKLDGYGYNQTETANFENELKALAAKGLDSLRTPKMHGTGRTVLK
jgi:hypothetical protein